MQVRSLLDIDEIKNFQNILEDWQMVPLNVEINNCSPLLIKYVDEEIYESLKDDPIIETIPFFIGMEHSSGMAKICYLFIKVHKNDNSGYTLHEVAFNLQNKKQVNDCKNILTTDNHGVILVSNLNSVLINYDLPGRITYANKLFIEEIVNIDFQVSDNFYEAISSLQAYKSDQATLLLWLTEISKEQHSSMIHIKI